MINKVIYLKSLVKNFKPKTEGLSEEMIKELTELGVDLMTPKVKPKGKTDFQEGKDFILNHTEEFLHHVVNFSLDDRIGDILHSKKSEEKI